jgi:hypothetical protein
MKKLLSLLLTVCLLASVLTVWAEEEPNLLEIVMSGIEEFNPEEALEIPEDEKLAISKDNLLAHFKEDINVFGIENSGITFSQLGSNENATYLPTAGLVLGLFELLGEDVNSHSLTVYATVSEYYEQWMTIVLDYTENAVFQLWWTPGLDIGEAYVYTDDEGNWLTPAGFYEEYSTSDLISINSSTLKNYINKLQGGSGALVVGKALFEISSDKQSIFINRPSISGGSGNYTIAYNLYDSNSNPVNYFYSTEARVAVTPGYGGTFNVFIVVTDQGTGETNTQNIGWQKINWPYASKLTVGKASYTKSSNDQDIFITRPSIKCKSGSVTIAYNIYDDKGNPVNYFYSDAARVAASPKYNGKFNVYIVVTDTQTKESNTQNIGWVTLNGYASSSGVYRALVMCQTAVPGCTKRPGYVQMNADLIAKLKLVNNGAYASHITSKQDLSRSGMLSAIASAYSGAKAGDVSFFWNATHGVTSNVSYTGALCTTETNGTCGYLYLSDLASALTKANPNNEVIVILSSCGSGAAVKGLGDEGEWSSQDANAFNRMAISAFAAADTGLTKVETEYNENGEIIKRRELCLPRFYVICSQDVYKSSWSYTTGRSFIGDALINGMTASSSYLKADSNKDHKVTFYELYKYIYDWCYDATSTLNPIQVTQRYPTTTEGGNYVVFTY